MKKGVNRCSGFSLTEVAIVLGILSIVLAGVWSVASDVLRASKVAEIQNQILLVVSNIRNHYTPMGKVVGCVLNYSFTAVIDDDDIRLIPIEMRSEHNTEGRAINHAAGHLTGASTDGSFRVSCLDVNGSKLQVHLRGLDKEMCVSLLHNFPVLSSSIGVVNMGAGGGSTTVDARNISAPGTTTLPLPLATASSWCNSLTNNGVYFDFVLRN